MEREGRIYGCMARSPTGMFLVDGWKLQFPEEAPTDVRRSCDAPSDWQPL